MRIVILTAIFSFTCSVSHAQESDVPAQPEQKQISELSVDSVTRIDFGVMRAESFLSQLIDAYKQKSLGDSHPTFYNASVVWEADASVFWLLGYFSEYYESDVTRGHCADALEEFRSLIFTVARVEDDQANELAKNIFAPSASAAEYATIATHISVAASIGHKDYRKVKVGCSAGLDGRNVSFDTH